VIWPNYHLFALNVVAINYARTATRKAVLNFTVMPAIIEAVSTRKLSSVPISMSRLNSYC